MHQSVIEVLTAGSGRLTPGHSKGIWTLGHWMRNLFDSFLLNENKYKLEKNMSSTFLLVWGFLERILQKTT